ncbi:NAD(P)H-binding protein [Nocardioides convexus]|uniref:NAD(P)H-binding protein n=1 Tax=Nocardioides convexus TaxID=2712224 RepID=UPI002418AFF2|nr:NAD(P)H-binding protein [Nocardioides convexus]
MTLVVTGATGHLGRLVVPALLAKGVPATDIVALGRDEARLAELAGLGVTTRKVDYTDAAAVTEALAGADRVLLISGSEVGQRLAQHQNVIDAAKAAGVSLLAYTSIPHADTNGMQARGRAPRHRGGDRRLRAAVVLPAQQAGTSRTTAARLPTYLEHGTVLGAAGDGKVSAATRADFAEAAAAVLVAEQPKPVYGLGGAAFTLAEPGGHRQRGERAAGDLHRRAGRGACRRCSRAPACPRRTPPCSPTPTSASAAASSRSTPPTWSRCSAARPPPWRRGCAPRSDLGEDPCAPRRSRASSSHDDDRRGAHPARGHRRPDRRGSRQDLRGAGGGRDRARAPLHLPPAQRHRRPHPRGGCGPACAKPGTPRSPTGSSASPVGRNVLQGRWTFQVVEEYDDGYYAAFKETRPLRS